MSWQTSPAATELEQVVMEWLRQMIGLSPAFTGVIQDTASTATLVAILMAREIATDFRFKEEGASAEGAGRLRVYASEETHSSVEKAVLLSGIGRRNYIRIPVDRNYAMRSDLLESRIHEDRSQGFIPACVVGTIGTTGSTAIDPIQEIGTLCQREKIFFHVDAAFAGNAAILPEKRGLLAGSDLADSFVFNPHKWLYTNFDCTAFYVKHPDLLTRTCGIQPEYLRTKHDAEVANFRDWGVQLGRRFRALKLWFVIRSFGVEGLQKKVREAIRLAQLFRSWVEEDPDFEILAPTPVSLVCFRYVQKGKNERELEQVNSTILDELNRSGKIFLTHTKLEGRYTLRLNTSQESTTEKDVLFAWELIRQAAKTRKMHA